LNARWAITDTVIPRGGGPDGQSPIFIPKGHVVSYNIWTMHRRKDIYGEDALEFKPERWNDLRMGWDYLPFNGGPRICVGQQFALTEASYTIVRLVQEFKACDARDDRPWAESLNLTLASGNGTLVAMTPR
jgi:cytochrome P450